MSLDHGVLNVPLSKRGDIDRELDRHKAEQARQAKAQQKLDAARTREQRQQARECVESATEALIAELSAKTGRTPKQVREFLRSEAHWNPVAVLRAFGRPA